MTPEELKQLIAKLQAEAVSLANEGPSEEVAELKRTNLSPHEHLIASMQTVLNSQERELVSLRRRGSKRGTRQQRNTRESKRDDMGTQQLSNVSEAGRHIARIVDPPLPVCSSATNEIHDIAAVFLNDFTYADASHVEWTCDHEGGILRLRVSTNAARQLAAALIKGADIIDAYKSLAKDAHDDAMDACDAAEKKGVSRQVAWREADDKWAHETCFEAQEASIGAGGTRRRGEEAKRGQR